MIYAIAYLSGRGVMYLNCVETCCYGDCVIGYFDLRPSCAMPLERYHADKLLAKIRDQVPKYSAAALMNADGKPLQSLSERLKVVPYPAADQEVAE